MESTILGDSFLEIKLVGFENTTDGKECELDYAA
jgi:hypothetical protein